LIAYFCLTSSNRQIEAAAATLSDSACPGMGIFTAWAA
jgi:hypothetical protein